MRKVTKYVGREFTQGRDIQMLLDGNNIIPLPVPTKPVETGDEAVDATAKTIWESKIDAHVKQDLKLEDNCMKPYSPIMVQCTGYMKANLRGHPD